MIFYTTCNHSTYTDFEKGDNKMDSVKKSLERLKEDLDETVLNTLVVKRSDLEILINAYEKMNKELDYYKEKEDEF